MFKLKRKIDRYFGVTRNNTSFSKEIISGIIVFFSMVYILPVNASIMNLDNQIPYSAVFCGTAVITFISCLLSGLFSKTPLCMSTCMGLNAYLAYTVTSMGYSAEEVLSLMFLLGILYFIISVTPLKMMIINALPKSIKIIITAGLGLFIAFVGLRMGGVIVNSESTSVALGDLRQPYVLICLFGIFLVLGLYVCKVKFLRDYSVIIALVVTALLGGFLNLGGVSNTPSFVPNESNDSLLSVFNYTFKCFDMIPSVLAKPQSYAILICMLIVHMFGSSTPVFANGEKLNYINKETGKLQNCKRVFVSDGVATLISGVLPASPTGYFVESSIGVEFGGRTGISSIVTSLLFLSTLFIFPVFNIFSPILVDENYYTPVTSLSLVMIGCLMFSQLKDLEWKDPIIVITCCVSILFIILTYSLTDGLGVGLMLYVIMMLTSGKGKKVNILIYILSLVFLVNFIISKIVIT